MPDLFEPDVELRWRGKQTKVKTVSLSFQTAEHIRGDVTGDDHEKLRDVRWYKKPARRAPPGRMFRTM